MNKKILYGMLLPLLAVVLVSAVATYYVMFSATFNVTPAITLSDNVEQPLGVVYSDSEEIVITGDPITITNKAPTERDITLTDNSGENVSVSYVGELVLSKKEVKFGVTPWNLTGEPTITIEYTIIGDKFSVEVINAPVGLEDYVLIYYADRVDRFSNVAKAVYVEEVDTSLPYDGDANIDEYDMCAIEGYDTCHGAKIWYVPSSAIDGDKNIIWSEASEFYFETNLIQFNIGGNLTIYNGSSLEITPVYTIAPYTTGNFVIITEVA